MDESISDKHGPVGSKNSRNFIGVSVGMDRRTFLKIAGMGSLAFASSCTSESDKKLFSLVRAPEDMVTGKANWYASTCRECPAGCGILAKNREGRIIKIEGNPLHPINKGGLCMRGQAALQGVYHPNRLKAPLFKINGRFQALSFSEATSLLNSRAAAARTGSNRARMLTETVGQNLMQLFIDALQNLNSPPPLVFESYAYESLKTANKLVFGIDGLASYHMDQADFLVSFGADFLETWLSPVEYAWKFKDMHAHHADTKNAFIHVSPFQSLTGANADLWLACNPGTERLITLGLIKQALADGMGKSLSPTLRQVLTTSAAPFDRDFVVQQTGIPPKGYDNLVQRLMQARRPLILGSGTGASDSNGLLTHVAVNLLNLLLDPDLHLMDFTQRHRVEQASRRSDVLKFFNTLNTDKVKLLLINNTNPVFSMSSDNTVKEALERPDLFVVCFSNFMDETAALADLLLPVRLPLETWDEYGGKTDLVSTLQPAMGKLTHAPHLGDVILKACFAPDYPVKTYKDHLVSMLANTFEITDEIKWTKALQQGGNFDLPDDPMTVRQPPDTDAIIEFLAGQVESKPSELTFTATPSIRFFDGRGANRPWLCEIPDPLYRIAWQTPVVMHPETARANNIEQEDIVGIESKFGSLEAPVVLSELVVPRLLVMNIGQGHQSFGNETETSGLNPLQLLSPMAHKDSGGTDFNSADIKIRKTGRTMKLAGTSGSLTQHGRTLALSITLAELQDKKSSPRSGLTMGNFPLTLPLPEGYDSTRDVFPSHGHDTYRWGMVVDLDRCIGCGACSAACYAENNIGVVGEKRILQGREMAWMSVERYHASDQMERVTFLPMMCQHCDNAPCESVCPVYAPHHSKEGLNNQIYNRCIGTRYCVQNCPYKVRRFNWFTWKWPEPMNLQLNPDVTVRSKGVMEKCSFCIQRIKAAHNVAKNENRLIRDGEVAPACVQTCPTKALVFGNLMDKNSRVRKLTENPRAYQALGYLNTKPAVIYLKKVIQDI
jgi:anaerobic selenocysteine-containing dehydrogenase/Fe-S-cluster-containing dehydrogenase component